MQCYAPNATKTEGIKERNRLVGMLKRHLLVHKKTVRLMLRGLPPERGKKVLLLSTRGLETTHSGLVSRLSETKIISRLVSFRSNKS